jgi:hypothetical protein
MMNKNKIVSESQLKEIFKEVPLEKLPSGFAEVLMSKIEKESFKKRMRRKLIVSLQIAAGIASMLLFPALAIHLCNIFIPGFSFSFSDLNIGFDSNSVVIGFAVVMLLIIDSLHKKYVAKKTR